MDHVRAVRGTKGLTKRDNPIGAEKISQKGGNPGVSPKGRWPSAAGRWGYGRGPGGRERKGPPRG